MREGLLFFCMFDVEKAGWVVGRRRFSVPLLRVCLSRADRRRLLGAVSRPIVVYHEGLRSSGSMSVVSFRLSQLRVFVTVLVSHPFRYNFHTRNNLRQQPFPPPSSLPPKALNSPESESPTSSTGPPVRSRSYSVTSEPLVWKNARIDPPPELSGSAVQVRCVPGMPLAPLMLKLSAVTREVSSAAQLTL